MKVSFVLLIVALIIAVCSAAVQHSEPGQNQIDYCVMCDDTVSCNGSKHTCTMVNLGQCTQVKVNCTTVSYYFIKASQTGETVSIQNYDQDTQCNTAVGESVTNGCNACAQDGSIEVLCYEAPSSSSTSDANTFTISSIFIISMIIFASLI